MIVRRPTHLRMSVSIFAAALLAGCAMTPPGPTVQVMPGPGHDFATFQANNAACKSFASDQVKGQADAANQRAFGAALLTTALGAATGGAVGNLGYNAGGGAGVGAALGASAGSAIASANNANDQMGIQAQYDMAFSQCMYAKGDLVPGFAPPIAIASSHASGPAPDPLVRSTQSELIRLGFLKGAADGFSGPLTRAAISNFEQANGMPASGSPTPRLLAKLQSTPTGAASATASVPSGWVQPTGAPAATPVSATTAAPAEPTGWVAPAKP